MDTSLDWILDAGTIPQAGAAQVANAEQTQAQGTRLPMQQTPSRLKVMLAPTVFAAGASQTISFDNSDPEYVTVIACATPLMTIAQGSAGNTLAAVAATNARFTVKRSDTIIITNPTGSNLTVSVLAHDAAFKLEV